MDLLSRFKKPKSVIGLDIGSHSVKIVKVSQQNEEYFLDALGMQVLEPGTFEGGEIKKKDQLLKTISAVVAECDTSIRDVVISISGSGILSEKFTFKINPEDNLEETILWEASQRSPFDVEGITIDYKILGKEPDKNEVEVLLVAAKNQVAEKYVSLLQSIGLRPVIIDVNAFAITNSYSIECDYDDLKGVTALLNIGHSITNITFLKDGIYQSTRDISASGILFCNTLHRHLNITEEHAKRVLMGDKDETLDELEVEQSISYSLEELSSNIDLAYTYFRNSSRCDRLDRIILSGGGAYIKGIQPFLEGRHNTDVKISNALSYLNYDENILKDLDPEKVSAYFTVAIGLALRKVGH